jgi:hypothetical protein
MTTSTIKINGKDAIILYKSSKSQYKDRVKFNKDTIKVIDELLKGSDNIFVYKYGLTTLNTLNDRDEVRLDINRIANHITELRKIVPNGWLITFRYTSDKKSRYGLVKSKKAIAFMKSVIAQIKANL